MLRSKTIKLTDNGNELEFIIRQMPAVTLETWLYNAVSVLAEGLSIEAATVENIVSLASERGVVALLAHLDVARALPLLDEMLGCCSRVVGGVEERCTRTTVENYIFEVKTLVILRKEAALLNLGFLLAEIEKLSASQEQAPTR